VTLFLRQSWAIAAKDLRMEFRNREVISSVGAFALIVLMLFSFAFDPISNPDARSMSGGLLWIVYAFAAILILNRSFGRETANGCLIGLTAAPAGGGAVFLGKTIASFVLLFLLEVVSLLVFKVFYDLSWTGSNASLMTILLLGAWALAATGSMFGAVTANNRLRELMMPVLVLPMVLPALIACVQLTTLILAGEPIGESFIWMRLLIVFNVIFTLLGATLTDFVLSS
jgi:heme exporter protein B